MDNALLQEILLFLREHHPNDVFFPEHEGFSSRLETKEFQSSLYYLADHGLIELKNIRNAIGPAHKQVLGAKLKAKGIDYLLPDGGLTEFFNTVTIRFDADTLRAILETTINNSSHITPADKPGWISRLRELPADAIKHLTLKLLEKGLDHSQEAIQIIETFFRSLGQT